MALLLEAFDAPPAAAPAGPSPDWLEGHAAGLAEGRAQGRAEAEAGSAEVTRELARSLQDLAFTYAEAREQVLLSLGPLFALLTDRLLPAMAAEVLGPWIAEVLLEAARGDSAAPFLVEVHPDRLEAVAACVPPGCPARLEPAPALGRNAARIAAPARESDLDLDACLAALREALSALLDPTGAQIRHG